MPEKRRAACYRSRAVLFVRLTHTASQMITGCAITRGT
jgi:hypothetical protein